MAEKVTKETWNHSAALISETQEAFFFHLVLPHSSCIQMYNLLLIYTTDGFKDHVNLPIEVHAIPAEEQGAEGTESK